MSVKILLILPILFMKSSQIEHPEYFRNPVKPEHYNITILVLFNELTYGGFVDILTECNEETNSIKLHASKMVIDKDTITVKEAEASTEVTLSGVEIDEQNETVVMNLDENLKKDVKYMVHIEYKANLTKEPYGFYQNWYLNEENNEGLIANTHFEPIWARRAFPCFDMPHMKATFQLTIGHEDGLFALNNMPLLSTEPIEGREGYIWEHFDKTPRMSTYLVAFAILDDGMKNISSGKITFWYSPKSRIPKEYALKKSVEMLSYLEDYFEIKYELPKLDFLVVNSYPTFAGACENWGLVIAEEKTMYEDESLNIIAHELFHMWIGNIITMKCFAEVWLKEGITNYYESILMDKFKELASRDSDIADEFFRIMNLLEIGPLSLEYCPTDDSTILAIYGKDTYFKGSLFIRMLQMTLGLKDLKKPLQLLLNKFKYQNFDEDDLWAALKETISPDDFPSHLDIHTVFKSWTKQKGYPIIEVSRNYDTGTATLQQRIFKSEEPDKDAGLCWWIPITYTTKCKRKFKDTIAKNWMVCPKEPLTIIDLNSSEWMLINLQAMGMFIVKYDDTNWKLLTETLRDKSRFEVIPFWDRFKLILDAYELTFVGLLSHESLLTTLLYLKHETNVEVWLGAMAYFGKLDWLSDDIVVLKHQYMKTLIEPHFSEKMFQLKGLSKKEKQFREQILINACKSGIEKCINEALRLFKVFKDSLPKITMDRDTRLMVFCLVVRHGPPENSVFLWELYNAELEHNINMDITYGFSCQKQNSARVSTPAMNNSRHMFELFTSNRNILEPSSTIIQNIEPVLEEPYGSKIFVNGILEMSDRIHEKETLNNLETLFENEKFQVYKEKTDRILKRIRSNIDWKKNYSEEIKFALLSIVGRENQTEETSTVPILALSSKPIRKRVPSNCFRLFDTNYYWIPLCLVFSFFFQ